MARSKDVAVMRANVPVFLFEQDSQWVAYRPPLEVSSYGDTQEEAKVAFEDALAIFFEEAVRRGTLEKELIRMGWTLANSAYLPPAVPPQVVHSLGSSKKVDRRILIPAVEASKYQRTRA